MEADYYGTYTTFQGWHQPPDASHDPFYQMETSDLGLKPGSKIIEIGFGQGRFLDFARRSNYDVRGLELIPDLVAQVRARGHVAEIGTRLSQFKAEADTFDLVVAIDVIEHLKLDQLVEFFEDAKVLLKTGGHILLRFPNGSSPFSMRIYNSDVTHRLHLNGGSLFQICEPLGLEVVRCGNPAVSVVGATALRMKRKLQSMVRAFLEYLIGFAYFGLRESLDINLVAVLRKA
jgi:SAM-dependent methyltransferase